MSLDLARVSPQIRQMGRHLLERRELAVERLRQARATFAAWAPPLPAPDSNWPMKLLSLPPVGVVRETKSNTLPSFRP